MHQCNLHPPRLCFAWPLGCLLDLLFVAGFISQSLINKGEKEREWGHQVCSLCLHIWFGNTTSHIGRVGDMDILLDAEIVLAWHITNMALTCMHVRLQQHTGCL